MKTQIAKVGSQKATLRLEAATLDTSTLQVPTCNENVG